MGLFYAYLQDEQNDCYRYLITFADREIADEWWRVISSPPSPYIANVGRISPQFYTQNNQRGNDIAYFFSFGPHAGQFHRKMFFTSLYNLSAINQITIHPITITDHINGRWYFIRSKADSHSHWYLRIRGNCLVCDDAHCDAIHASSEYRTKFCVRVRNPANDSEDFVMIGKDEILVTARKDYTVYINGEDDLKATKGYQGETGLLFKDFKNRFVARPEKQVNGEVWEYVESAGRGLGEVWELVD